MSTKSHIHKTYGTLKKMSFCTKGYVGIHIQRLLFDIEIGIWKILRLKIHALVSFYTWKIFFKIKIKSQFFVEFQSFLN
jgi:hypothetical protein